MEKKLTLISIMVRGKKYSKFVYFPKDQKAKVHVDDLNKIFPEAYIQRGTTIAIGL